MENKKRVKYIILTVACVACFIVYYLSTTVGNEALFNSGSGDMQEISAQTLSEDVEGLDAEEARMPLPQAYSISPNIRNPLAAKLPEVKAEAATSTAVAAQTPEPTPELLPSAAPSKIKVHIVGAVINQGVYELEEGARVIDAVTAAGGLTEDADHESVNMSKFIYDTQQIKIYKIGEERVALQGASTEPPTIPNNETAEPPQEPKQPEEAQIVEMDGSQNQAYSQYIPPAEEISAGANTPNTEIEAVEPAYTPEPAYIPEVVYAAEEPAKAYEPPVEAAPEPAPAPSDGKININTATKKELISLPGIGDAIAGYIIEYRDKNGSFRSIEEIKNVQRIGDKTFEAIRGLIKVQ